MRLLVLILLAAFACHGQASGPATPEQFGKAFVDAIQSRDVQRRIELLHPRTRECMTSETHEYFDWIFSRQMKYVVQDGKYAASVRPADPPANTLGFEYPVTPRRQLQVDFSSGADRGITVVLLLANEGSRWYEVLPCPGPDAVLGARYAMEESQRQDARARGVIARMPQSLRDDLTRMLKDGRRVDAIRRLADATGEELVVARIVVDELTEPAGK